MKFGVFTHAEHILQNKLVFSYGPYVSEMNLWTTNFDRVIVMAPLLNRTPNKIELAYNHSEIIFEKVIHLHFKNDSFTSTVKKSIKVFRKCISLMKKCDHLHIRCPGNIGLIALIATVFFPEKPKTIKYAGNWDPKSKQPSSYNFQKWLLKNNWIIKNKKVLIYGKWPNQPNHVLSFFTASYSDFDKTIISKSINDNLNFIYCGALVPGKNPLLAIKIIHKLLKRGHPVNLNIYGDGKEKGTLEEYIIKNGLSDRITIHGNQTKDLLIAGYKKSHFCILPSKSEGWPKAIAEGMFYGCVPIATNISCIPWMLDNGTRGIIIDGNLTNSTDRIEAVINSEPLYYNMSQKAMNWSKKYTMEKFKTAIVEVL